MKTNELEIHKKIQSDKNCGEMRLLAESTRHQAQLV